MYSKEKVKKRDFNYKKNKKMKYNLKNKNYKSINEKIIDIKQSIDRIENLLIDIKNEYNQNKNADLMIIERLENIADFLRNNYNIVVEEREIFSINPHDD